MWQPLPAPVLWENRRRRFHQRFPPVSTAFPHTMLPPFPQTMLSAPAAEQLHQTMFEGLCRVNQDFREVTKMFDRSCVELEIYEFETGPFKGRDIRVKNKYVAQ